MGNSWSISDKRIGIHLVFDNELSVGHRGILPGALTSDLCFRRLARVGEAQDADAPIVAVRDLNKSFGDVQALIGVSLDVYAGTVVGLLSPNGAGNTTLMERLMEAELKCFGRSFDG